MKFHTLYGLRQPGKEIRYIGITCQKLQERLRKHLIEPEDSHKNRWFKKLLREENIKPEIIPYCVGLSSEEEAKSLERAVIRCLREARFNLVNSTDGGDGVTMTPETRAKIGAAHIGKIISPEHRAKISAANTGKKCPPEKREAQTGKKHSPEHCAKIRAAQTGKKYSPEHCAAISAANTGKTATPEARVNMSAAQTERRARERQEEKHAY